MSPHHPQPNSHLVKEARGLCFSKKGVSFFPSFIETHDIVLVSGVLHDALIHVDVAKLIDHSKQASRWGKWGGRAHVGGAWLGWLSDSSFPPILPPHRVLCLSGVAAGNCLARLAVHSLCVFFMFLVPLKVSRVMQ